MQTPQLQIALCELVFQRLEEHASKNHSNLPYLARRFDVPRGRTFTGSEMMQVLRDLAGQLNPQEAQAMMHRLDPNNSGKFTFERLLEVGRNIKLQRKQEASQTLNAEQVVRKFTQMSRWHAPNDNGGVRLTGAGTTVLPQASAPDWAPVALPKRKYTDKPIKMKYRDYTGMEGGAAWHTLGEHSSRARARQPPPSRPLYPSGQTLGEVYANADRPDRSPSNKTMAWKAGASLNPSLNATSMRRRRSTRGFGCSGFVAPRMLPPVSQPGRATWPMRQSRSCTPRGVHAPRAN